MRNTKRKKSERVVSRVLSSRFPGSDDHLSGPSIARRHERPTRKSRTGRPYPHDDVGGTLPYVALLQAGFAKHPASLPDLVSSYLTVSPLPVPMNRDRRSSFLWHCPWGCPLSRFGTALPCGARTFLSPLPGSDHLTRSDNLIGDRIQNSGVSRKHN